MHGKLPKEELSKKKTARRGRRALAWLIVLGAVGAALYFAYAPSQQQPQQRLRRFAGTGPVPVLVAAAKRADVPVYLDTVGTVQPLNTVTVRPQVDGKLIAVLFKEGQDVKKGDVLARIDPTIYKAQLDQTKAKKAQDEAQLANAKNDLARYQKLAATNAINKQQADTQKALVAQYTALVQADQAAIENAQATLGYTTITAPISGRTGLLNVDEGNYVRASDSSSTIVTISKIKPIAVLFNLPQQDLDRVNAAFAKGPLPVDAQRPATGDVIARGKLTVIDNQVELLDRHSEAESRISQSEPAALARTVRQCAAADRHIEERGGGADRRRAARAEGRLRLRRRQRRQGGDASRQGREAG